MNLTGVRFFSMIPMALFHWGAASPEPEGPKLIGRPFRVMPPSCDGMPLLLTPAIIEAAEISGV